jgi:DedD protein
VNSQVEARLKQRVTGAVVLTTLAIIFLPMLLDGTSSDRARVMATIPEAPSIDIKQLTFDDARLRMREMEIESAAQLPEIQEDPIVETLPATAFSLDKNNLPVSWSLQLGSFRNPNNATGLRQKLREADYRSYVIESKGQGGEADIFRVYIGPMLQKIQLEKIQGEVQAKFSLQGPIVRYRVEDDKGQLGG